MTIDIIVITVPGEPVGKARARVVRTKSGASRTYTPQRTVDYEQRVQAYARLAMVGRKVLEGPVELELLVSRRIPASWSKAKRSSALKGALRPTSRPDVSNIVKSIEDGLNGIVWHDDAQITDLIARQWYSAEPDVVVIVTALRAQGGEQ